MENQRTGAKSGSSSEPALKPAWWKRGIRFLAHSLTLSLSCIVIVSCKGDIALSFSQIKHKAFEGWDLLGILPWIPLVSSVSSAAVDAFFGPFPALCC